MMPEQTIADWKKQYHKALRPTDASISVARELLSYRSQVTSSQDNEKIIRNAVSFEQDFFRDMVSIAKSYENMPPGTLNVTYINAILNEYNYSAFSATDGYIVLGDDYFTRLLFFLSFALILDTQNQIDDQEQNNLKQYVQDFVFTDYIQQRQFDFSKHPLSASLLQKEEDAVLMANYFFYSLFAFILCHELAHHILGHTYETALKQVGPEETDCIEVDQRSRQDEFEADRYGYGLFLKLITTVDDNYPHAFFQYYYPYTPVILFDLFEHFDHWKSVTKQKVAYNTHPSPKERLDYLKKHFNLDDEFPLCKDIQTSLHWLMKI